ncbi:MAG: RidA family protein [Roseiarcus sp.]
MRARGIDGAGAPAPTGSYVQAVEVESPKRLLFISGQIPMDQSGAVPVTFSEQCELTWRNVELQLRAARMSLDDLVKVTTFLSDRKYREENGEIRRRVLAGRRPALTVIITEIYDPAWLLEIEAVAAD